MTKTARNSSAATEESFHRHYATIWGQERWHQSLYPALKKPTRHATVVNRYAPPAGFSQCMEEVGGEGKLERIQFPNLKADLSDHLSEEVEDERGICCFSRGSRSNGGSDSQVNGLFPPPRPVLLRNSGRPVMTHWNLDAASALVAHMLDVHPGDKVVDLCAAPGGKSVTLAQPLWPQHYSSDDPAVTSPQGVPPLSHLHSNELDRARHKRLAQNLQAYLPPALFASRQAASTSVDSATPLAARHLPLGPQGYDRVLADAPCSSERHIIHAAAAARAGGRTAPEMANWRPGSSKRLVKTQVELLMTALRTVRVGGRVVYATCSVEMGENDGVVAKLVREVEKEGRKGGRWMVEVGLGGGEIGARVERELEERWAERTDWGWIVLPDHPSGGRWGPLFFAVITKVELV